MSPQCRFFVNPAHYFRVDVSALVNFSFAPAHSVRSKRWARDVVTVDCPRGLLPLEICRVIVGHNFLLLTRQKRKVIVGPENGSEVLSTLSLSDAQVHHNRNAATRVAYRDSTTYLASLLFFRRSNFQPYLRHRVQSAQIPTLRFRRIHGILLVLPIHHVRLGRKPIEIVAQQLARGIMEL